LIIDYPEKKSLSLGERLGEGYLSEVFCIKDLRNETKFKQAMENADLKRGISVVIDLIWCTIS
jgi:hypothetical protein